VAAHLVMSVLA